MTRFLSESLQAIEPNFRLQLRHLEAASGHQGADIRLTAELKQLVPTKIHELGLDPHDTTAAELYHSLSKRFHQDDDLLTRTLQARAGTHISAECDVVAGMVLALDELGDQQCYALKNSSFKTLMAKTPPKKVMKQLGYRSVASFIKHESPAQILAAAAALEDSRWHNNLLAAYKKLKSRDFETRNVTIIQADCAKWQVQANQFMQGRTHNVLSFKELGVVVLMPFAKQRARGSVISSLALAAAQLNELAATSTYLKLAQVRADFGHNLQLVVASEAALNASHAGQSLSWQTVHRYYQHAKEQFDEAIFEPHVQHDDMTWCSVEQSLTTIEPKLIFWHATAHLSTLHDAKPVSLNLMDVAFNAMHQVPFAQRLTHHSQKALWQELQLRYLQPHIVEQSLVNLLQPQLATEYAIA